MSPSVYNLSRPIAVSVFKNYLERLLCVYCDVVNVCAVCDFGSKVRRKTFGGVAMGSAVLFILRSRLFVYSTGTGVEKE